MKKKKNTETYHNSKQRFCKKVMRFCCIFKFSHPTKEVRERS